MHRPIENNLMKISEISIPAEGIISEVVVLKAVRPVYALDSDGRRTDKIEAVRYDCMNLDNYSNFTLKVQSTRPVITEEELEAAEEAVYIAIPVEQVEIKPFEIKYGIARVTILAPFVKIVEN